MRKNDDLAAWRIFFRVIELGSISKAADEANVEPSSISRRLSALEHRVGVQLLNRSSRSIKLTEAGAHAYDKIHPLINEIDHATDALVLEPSTLSGLIRLAAPVSLGDHDILLQWLTDFQILHPDIQIELKLSNSFVDLLEENIDLAIRVGSLKDERLIARPLGEMHAIMCASPHYLEQHGTPQHPSELLNHRQVIYTGMMARGKVTLTRGEEQFSLVPQGHMRINHLNAIHRAVLAGAGIHLIAPLWHCVDDLQTGRLIQILPDWHLPSSSNHLMRLPHRHTPQRVQALSDWLHSHWTHWTDSIAIG